MIDEGAVDVVDVDDFGAVDVGGFGVVLAIN